jgi:hypothetical protein
MSWQPNITSAALWRARFGASPAKQAAGCVRPALRRIPLQPRQFCQKPFQRVFQLDSICPSNCASLQPKNENQTMKTQTSPPARRAGLSAVAAALAKADLSRRSFRAKAEASVPKPDLSHRAPRAKARDTSAKPPEDQPRLKSNHSKPSETNRNL